MSVLCDGRLKINLKDWENKPGVYITLVTAKLDGVQCVRAGGQWFSRTGKPLYYKGNLPDGVYEYYKENWETSISDFKTSRGRYMDGIYMYRIDPAGYKEKTWQTPMVLYDGMQLATPEFTAGKLAQAVELGFEGCVYHTVGKGGSMYKHKFVTTYDTEVKGWIRGKGVNANRMGSLVTDGGHIGTGFTFEQRDLPAEYWLGRIIEVESMGLTPNGLYRFPRFVRMRPDKCSSTMAEGLKDA